MNVIESKQNASRASHRWARLPPVLAALLCMCVTSAFAETRSLKIQHLHTGEKAEVVFKRNGRYDQAGLKKINIMLRDWRRNEPTKMDPRLLDLVWQAYRASGSTGYINVVSGYRSPTTNAMLRSRSKGVARESQHMVGRAMDFFLPDVPLKKLRDIGLKMQGGGVGYYPTSGSPFIHMDVGNVRHWPGISRQELARVFPNGKTLHVPSDGKPLPGYDQALVAYKSRKAAGTPNIEVAGADASQGKSRGLLATLFGGRDEDEADDTVTVAAAVPAPRKPVRSVEPKSVQPKSGEPRPIEVEPVGQGITVVAPQDAQRADIPMVSGGPGEEPTATKETPEAIVAALAPRAVPLPAFAPRPERAASVAALETVPFAVASAPPKEAEMAASEVPAGKADTASATVTPDIVSLNIPLPTWRPTNRAPQPEAAKSEDAIGALLAMNRPDDRGPLARKPLAAPVPKSEDPVGASPKAGRVKPRGDGLVTAAVARPAPLRSARAPTGADRVTSTTAPVIAAHFIRTAPEQVYLDGFKAKREPSDHRRFTGSAVKFLPMASFK